MINAPVERFPALDALEDVLHAFVLRVPGLDVRADREVALRRLDAFHELARRSFGTRQVRCGEQVHGNAVAVVTVDSAAKSAQVDALITRDPEVLLGIRVADCCAVYLVDSSASRHRFGAFGKKGNRIKYRARGSAKDGNGVRDGPRRPRGAAESLHSAASL